MSTFDVAVIGAGSVGTPLALYLARAGLSVGVFDAAASAGRGENRAAIGGIRATHSEPAKVLLCQEALEVFSSWEAETGDDIEWRRGGYLFVAYRDEDARSLRQVVELQRSLGLDIEWITPSRVQDLVPGIETDGLLGGTFSAGDGSASPLRAVHSFRVWAERAGARFHFEEPVWSIRLDGDRVAGVLTPRGEYSAGAVINAAGAAAASVGHMVGVELPVTTDAHEAGVTDPVARFLEPMLVDLRPGPASKNMYCYQSATGQLLFALTPDPLRPGTDRRSTSGFLPEVSRRLVELLPRLRHLNVRRTWSGLYPMTPDGSPLIGPIGPRGHLVAVGMCGQGFMLGPGVARCLARHLTGSETSEDRRALSDLRPDRDFAHAEVLT